MKTPNYITPTGLAALKSELKELIQKERPALVKTVAWAASNGDRSENADYIYGKRRLREIDRRVAFLTDKIETAQVIDPATIKTDKVVFGMTVVIEDEDGNEKTYQIVGEDEISIPTGKISWRSPMATALLGKGIGDVVIIQKPTGPAEVSILRYQVPNAGDGALK
jgi:transcription elongation factor GreB